MKTLFAFLISISILTACEKSQEFDGKSQPLSGRFIGTFYRTNNDTVNVVLTFTGNNFEGISDRAKYPAICNGTFSTTKVGDDYRVNFDNTCVWTADFDWSLILDGEYDLKLNPDNSVTIVRHSFASSDYYTLWKVVR
jgi:hypothetical protein